MAPPAVAIFFGFTAAVGIAVAFHHFVYEPHLAPRLEVAATNWLAHRRQKRREADAYRAVPDEDDGNLQDKTSDIVPPVEMDTMVKEEAPVWRSGRPLTLNEAGTSELRKRNTSNHALEEESVWTATPTNYEPLTPTLIAPRAQSPPTQAPPSTTTISHTSTPSTVESSLLNFGSPSDPLMALSPSQNVLLRNLSLDSVTSQRDHLADSILSNTVHKSLFSAHASPIQSPIRISPRALQVNLAPTSDLGEDDDAHPLSQGHEPLATRSPLASTIYGSFTGIQDTLSPSLPLSATLSPQAPPPQFVILSPLSDSLSLVEDPTATASASTASWSDIASAGAEGDRDELFLGSDAESWAHVRRT